MSGRTKAMIAVLALVAAVAGGTWLSVREARGALGPGDSVELPQTGRPVLQSGYFPLIGGLSASRDRRCVYFQRAVDPQAYENPPLIAVEWPEGFEGKISGDGDFSVLNARGHVVARESELIGIAGAFARRTSDDECLRGARIFAVQDVTRAYFAE